MFSRKTGLLRLVVAIGCSLTVVASSLAQGSRLWLKREISGGYPDYGKYHLAVDHLGNIFVSSTSKGVGTVTDILVVKYSPEGKRLWSYRYDGPIHKADDAEGIVVDTAGNAYIAGTSWGNQTSQDIVIVKLDPAGGVLWTKRWDGVPHGRDRASGIAIDLYGNISVTGSTFQGLHRDYDWVTISLFPTGRTRWLSFYTGPDDNADSAYEITTDKYGSVLVAGNSSGDSGLTGFGIGIVKYSPTGIPLWMRTYMGEGSMTGTPRGIAVDGDANVYVTGSADRGPTNHSDFVTMKFDEFGTYLWERYFHAGDHEVPAGLAVDATQNVYIAGGSNLGHYLVKHAAGGAKLWARKVFAVPGESAGVYDITSDSLGNILLAGYSVGNSTGIDYLVWKYAPNGTKVWQRRYNGLAGAHHDAARVVTIDGQDNVIVAGESSDGASGVDVVTIKYSP